jgi:hypothetical protein
LVDKRPTNGTANRHLITASLAKLETSLLRLRLRLDDLGKGGLEAFLVLVALEATGYRYKVVGWTIGSPIRKLPYRLKEKRHSTVPIPKPAGSNGLYEAAQHGRDST